MKLEADDQVDKMVKVGIRVEAVVGAEAAMEVVTVVVVGTEVAVSVGAGAALVVRAVVVVVAEMEVKEEAEAEAEVATQEGACDTMVVEMTAKATVTLNAEA